MYNSETWDVAFTLTDTKIQEVRTICTEVAVGSFGIKPVAFLCKFIVLSSFQLVSIVTVSPCGEYLAASCKDGLILVWNLKTKGFVNS